MPLALITPLAAASDGFQIGRPLFGNIGLALVAVLGAIALLIVVVALVGRWLAATHPEPQPVPVIVAQVGTPESVRSLAPDVAPGVAPEVVPVILAAVAEAIGGHARVSSIRPSVAVPITLPSIEALMQEWSHEGRREIYSSHRVR